jgi:hypothetical protein
MMTAQAVVARSCAPVTFRTSEALSHRTLVEVALRKTGSAEHAPECEFLVRYAELKSCEPGLVRRWLEALEQDQLLQVRDVFETAATDCGGDVHELSMQPFRASANQLKLVPQFWSDGSPFVNFRKPRLNTVDAIDDALGGLFVPVLRQQ